MRRTDTASLVIAARPDAIYRAFADPDALMTWLPPGRMTGRALEYDFREGGRCRIELAYEGAAGPGAGKTTERTDISSGCFLSLIPGERIVQSVEFESAEASFAGEMLMTWTFDPLGEGTERLEEALASRFPDTPVVRIDRDTTRGRRTREALLDSLSEDGARLLVGTQMLAKGHDLARLTLVVVVGVDEGLYSIDFRAGERLAQLVVQVAGRAGRAQHVGEVILQTHDPAHPLLRGLIERGYAAVARDLLAERRAAQMPPYAQMALLRAEAPTQEELDAFLAAAVAAAPAMQDISLHGPLAAPIPRRAGALRGQILVESESRPAMQAFLATWLDAVRALPKQRNVRWSIDVDPVDLY